MSDLYVGRGMPYRPFAGYSDLEKPYSQYDRDVNSRALIFAKLMKIIRRHEKRRPALFESLRRALPSQLQLNDADKNARSNIKYALTKDGMYDECAASSMPANRQPLDSWWARELRYGGCCSTPARRLSIMTEHQRHTFG